MATNDKIDNSVETRRAYVGILFKTGRRVTVTIYRFIVIVF